MIVAVGIDVDTTFPVFVAAALRRGVPIAALNIRAAVDGEWRIPLPPAEPAEFWYGGRRSELRVDDAYFCRIIDLSAEQRDTVVAQRWNALTRALIAWFEQIPGPVANRPLAGSHNGSKPLHEATLAKMGFRVPESITSADVDQLREFVRERPAVSKTICGMRADTALATADLLADFDPRSGPIHLQRHVPGGDCRIHVVGDRLVAQRLAASGGVDYREEGRFDELEVFDPPPGLRDALIRSSAELGLAFAGWDFRIDDRDEFWCLEVNPMPGYGPYDLRCGGAISELLFDYLGGATM